MAFSSVVLLICVCELSSPVFCEFKALVLCALQTDFSLVTVMILSSFPWALLFFPIAEVPDRFYADVNSLLYFVIKYSIWRLIWLSLTSGNALLHSLKPDFLLLKL